MIEFYKYSALASDFVLVDNRLGEYCLNNQVLIERICDQKTGVGAEGLLVLNCDQNQNIHVILYNIDGNQRILDLSAGLCVGKFLLDQKLDQIFFSQGQRYNISAQQNNKVRVSIDYGHILEKNKKYSLVNVLGIQYVSVVRELDHYSVSSKARNIVYELAQDVQSVSFVEQEGPEIFKIRTYKTALLEEVLSCGSAAVAVAMSMKMNNKTNLSSITIQTNVADMVVSFENHQDEFSNIALSCEVDLVFKGTFYNR